MKFAILPKVVLGFLAIVLVMLTLGIYCLSSMSRINEATLDLSSSVIPSFDTIDQIRTSINQYRRAQLQHVVEISGRQTLHSDTPRSTTCAPKQCSQRQSMAV